MQKKWNISEPNPSLQKQLCDELQIFPVVSQLLINRKITNIKDAELYLNPDLSRLYDPFLFKDMDKAVERIKRAKQDGEKVLIYGDYDVDGVTSSVLLHNLLVPFGVDVMNYIPHRMEDGYGLNYKVAEVAVENNVKVIITADCGINSKDEVAAINKHNIDVLIFDHHEPEEGRLPDAHAIIDAKQKDCGYPVTYLATAGLIAKFSQALLGEVKEDNLDIVAVGTIADVAPLIGENRIFAKYGLQQMANTKNFGLDALLDISKVKRDKITSQTVGFGIAPRINAAGRMDSAFRALELFLCSDQSTAQAYARELDDLNVQRQKTQKDVVQEAMDIVEQDVKFEEEKVIVLGKEGWHKGVLGIVASRLKDKFSKPTVVIGIHDGVGVASCRSIQGFELHEALAGCAEFLEAYGGHAMAAGLTIKEENIADFRGGINRIAHEHLSEEDLIPVLEIDSEITLSDIDLEFTQKVKSLAPYGEGNPEPLFCMYDLRVIGSPQVLGKNTLKFWISDGQQSISCVGFGMGEDYIETVTSSKNVDVAFHLGIDDWNKAPTPQLMLKDVRLSK